MHTAEYYTAPKMNGLDPHVSTLMNLKNDAEGIKQVTKTYMQNDTIYSPA